VTKEGPLWFRLGFCATGEVKPSAGTRTRPFSPTGVGDAGYRLLINISTAMPRSSMLASFGTAKTDFGSKYQPTRRVPRLWETSQIDFGLKNEHTPSPLPSALIQRGGHAAGLSRQDLHNIEAYGGTKRCSPCALLKEGICRAAPMPPAHPKFSSRASAPRILPPCTSNAMEM
jgi:hypothetical protein